MIWTPFLAPVTLLSRCRTRVMSAFHADVVHWTSSVQASQARPSRDCGLLPLPKGEGGGEASQTIESSLPAPPTPLPDGERESRRASVGGRAYQQRLR